ncbi:glycerophosphodiester phosphodiesterase [Myxococcota bacterium]|nr:glycerophosphodiester phosphodiesterase [Myxococcota bacterium]
MTRPALLERLDALTLRAGPRRTLHIAHRGGAALAPENTLTAFEAAVAVHRTDMLELDVRPTADGVLVVCHDETLARCTESADRVDALDFAAIARLDAGYRFTPDDGTTYPFRGTGVRIPRLDDVLTAFPDVLLNVELKVDPEGTGRALAAVEPLVATLRSRGALDRVCLGSEDDGVGAALHAAAPGACHFFPAGALTALVLSLKSGAPPAVDPRFHVLDMPFVWQGLRLVDPALLSACAPLGLWVNAWTVDSPEEMRYLLDIGVGGVMTDRPDLLRRALDAREVHR